jgi:diaminobutyrate-2-oxoglutarate transaminase
MTASNAPKTSQFYLDRQKSYESNARSYPRRIPVAIKKAKGIRIIDQDGREFIDCLAGAGTLALGHNHPVVVKAIQDHLASEQPLHTLDLTTPAKDTFVEGLFGTLPADFARQAKIQFCGPSGADAVEAALKLVKIATGRRSILAFHGGYHGQTNGTLAMMGNLGTKSPIPNLMPEVHFLPYPYQYRCSFGCQQCDGLDSIRYIENMLDDPESGIPTPAGVVIEVVQGEGGSIPAPNAWMRELRRVTQQRGIPLILDEVQTGWGRTGKMYAMDHSEIMPDVLVLSKAIGGSLPMAVIVYRDELDVWKPGAHTGTFRGNQLAMATGTATLRYLLENDLPSHAANVGEYLCDRLLELKDRHQFVGDVRGRGLMIGMELVDRKNPDRWGRPLPDGELALQIHQECFKRGLILEVGGRHGGVLRLLPPLIVTLDETDQIARIIAEACAAVAASESTRKIPAGIVAPIAPLPLPNPANVH